MFRIVKGDYTPQTADPQSGLLLRNLSHRTILKKIRKSYYLLYSGVYTYIGFMVTIIRKAYEITIVLSYGYLSRFLL